MSSPTPSPDRQAILAARKRRNIALGLALGGFVILIFVVTVLKLAGGGVPQ
jgi:hypothetical protein